MNGYAFTELVARSINILTTTFSYKLVLPKSEVKEVLLNGEGGTVVT